MQEVYTYPWMNDVFVNAVLQNTDGVLRLSTPPAPDLSYIRSSLLPNLCEAVVKNFVTDYFTWTNKDGNYEVGGLQYIFGSKYAVFEEWSRYNYYADLDLYINQYGRDNLLQVKEVTVDKETAVAPDFATTEWSDDVKTDILYKSYEVNVSWTYENCALDTEQFVDGARFFLVNNNGRWEIAEFYDYDSIHEWEVENGLASTAEGGQS
jgi:hypothetical protein